MRRRHAAQDTKGHLPAFGWAGSASDEGKLQLGRSSYHRGRRRSFVHDTCQRLPSLTSSGMNSLETVLTSLM